MINLKSLTVPFADLHGAGGLARFSKMLKDFDVGSRDGNEHRQRYLAVENLIVRITEALIQAGLTKRNLYQSKRQYRLQQSLVPLVS